MTGQLRLILPLVWLAGAITAWEAVQTFLQGTPPALEAGPGWFLMLLVFAVLSELRPVPYTLGRVIKDESLTIADLSSSKPYYKVLFNASMYVTATGVAGVLHAITASWLQQLAPAMPP